MAKSFQKFTLSQSRDIPFNRLVLSQSNVRRIKAGVSIEELAQDIARRTLLQSLTVRPVLDGDGAETGMFEVPAGGRRYRALELLVKQKRLSRTAPVPCVVRTEGLAEEDSLAENVQRAPLHPLDQFRAFRDMREKGMSEEEISAAFFVSVQVVKQRLKLASVSPNTPESCLDIDVKSIVFGNQTPGLNDSAVAKAVDERHRRWSEHLPRESADLWDALSTFDPDSRDALFAHCVALSVNAVYEPWNRRPRTLAHADCIAEAVGLDVGAAGWSPTVDNYLGRVTKARIVQAVREAKGETAAQLIEHLRKGEMAERAQELLAGSGWIPELLRTPGRAIGATSLPSESSQTSAISSAREESAATGYEPAMADPEEPAEDALVLAEQQAVAAE